MMATHDSQRILRDFIHCTFLTQAAAQTPAVKPDPVHSATPRFMARTKMCKELYKDPRKCVVSARRAGVFPAWDLLDCVGRGGRDVWAGVEKLCGPGWKGCVGRDGRAVWAGVEGLCGPGWKGCVGRDGRAVWAGVEELCGPGWKGCVGRGGTAVWAGVERLCVSPCNQTPHYNSISGPPAAGIKGRGDQWSFPRRWNGPCPVLSP